MNRIMKKKIVMKYKIGKTICGHNSFGLPIVEDAIESHEESSIELFTETDKELKIDKNYIINDTEFTVEEKYFDISNNCFVYYTDIKVIDENLVEKYKVEIELQKIKYKELQETYNKECREHRKTYSELEELKNNKNKITAIRDCNCKKKKFFFF